MFTSKLVFFPFFNYLRFIFYLFIVCHIQILPEIKSLTNFWSFFAKCCYDILYKGPLKCYVRLFS